MSTVLASIPTPKLHPSFCTRKTPIFNKTTLPYPSAVIRTQIISKQNLYSPTKNVINKLPSVKTKSSSTLTDATATTTTSTSTPKPYRIWWSDVIVKKPTNVFANTKWNYLDKRALIITILVHGLSLFAPFTYSFGAFQVFISLLLGTGVLGICLSYHRQLTHKSFKLPKWLEYTFAYCGLLAVQGDPIEWVTRHRFHHKHADTEKDVHSPLEGFWFSHYNWLFDHRSIARKYGDLNNVEDLEKQPFYRFLRSTYLLHPFAFGLLLYAFGGFPYIVWGMGVRITCGYHLTFSLGSFSHIWGNQVWNTGDLSKNNFGVALLTAGEGWHNNHHAFEYSARHGLEWWQVDVTWYIICLLRAFGLATDVKLPLESHKQRLAFKT